jgi:hypothetical protein
MGRKYKGGAESLVLHKKLKTTGVFHRALADAEMTGHLWVNMIRDLKGTYRIRNVPFDLMRRLWRVGKKPLRIFWKNSLWREGRSGAPVSPTTITPTSRPATSSPAVWI